MKKTITILTIVILLAALIVGGLIFISPNGQEKSGKVLVAASFYPLAEFASQVGGSKVEVINITPNGVEPHDFEPSPRDVYKVNQADVFLFNGANLDPWAAKTAKDLKSKDVITVNMSTHFKLLKFNDPHIWLDPVLAQKEVTITADALVKADPKNASYYRKNAQKYIAKLEILNKEYRSGLSNCRSNDIISSHAAFNYLAKRYNFNVFAITVSPEQEPSPMQIAQMVNIVRDKNIKYIFFETLVSPKVAETIAQETGAKTLVFNPIEGLSEQEQKTSKNYITIMQENLKNLKKALDCQ